MGYVICNGATGVFAHEHEHYYTLFNETLLCLLYLMIDGKLFYILIDIVFVRNSLYKPNLSPSPPSLVFVSHSLHCSSAHHFYFIYFQMQKNLTNTSFSSLQRMNTVTFERYRYMTRYDGRCSSIRIWFLLLFFISQTN